MKSLLRKSPPNYRDMTGITVGNLTALHRAGTSADGAAVWIWQCTCGRVRSMSTTRVYADMRRFEQGQRHIPPSCVHCGRAVRGEQLRRLDTATVREIRRLFRLGVRRADIAKQFGITPVYVSKLAKEAT